MLQIRLRSQVTQCLKQGIEGIAGKDELGSAVGHIGIDYGFIPGKPVDLGPGRFKLFVQGPD